VEPEETADVIHSTTSNVDATQEVGIDARTGRVFAKEGKNPD
jgi:hypothetical protein